MDDRLPAALIVVGVFALLVALMWLGWRGKRRRQSEIAEPEAVPPSFGEVALSTEGLHVATTFSGRPVERVTVAGLGFRARTGVLVGPAGVALQMAGKRDVFIPAAAVNGAGRSNWTVDKAVEAGGLVVVTWSLGDTLVDTYLRVDDSAALTDALEALISSGQGSAANEL